MVHAKLLDLVPGRSGKAYTDWLKEQGGEFTAGIKTLALDPFRGFANVIRNELPEPPPSRTRSEISFKKKVPFGRLNNVGKEHRPRHRTHSAGIGRDPGGNTQSVGSNVSVKDGLAGAGISVPRYSDV
ncbi:hypothetical protein NicSoilB11_42660 (plasmid) [Arthrobacter sp. NicSoilB11]|nr:hypothetical protein NicSoilB11_42660 [Arthrobacter sp. NicSoilB11]GIU57990.1 hypothetical protein NicSoilC12_37390 [Arthrobacter sp. NicSoilC12]VXB97172.1 hypothetical protein ARTHRO8AJ_40170 [Arthrobacter sp. 8AJ]